MPGLESVRELLQRRGVPNAAAKRDALASTRPPPRPGGPGPSGGPAGPRHPGPEPEKKPAPSPRVGDAGGSAARYKQLPITPSRGEGGDRRKVDQGRSGRHKQRVAEIRAQQAKQQPQRAKPVPSGGGEKKPGIQKIGPVYGGVSNVTGDLKDGSKKEAVEKREGGRGTRREA